MKAIGRLGTAALRVLLPATEASACTDSWVETRYYCSPGAQDWRCKQTRTCRQCTSGKVCSSWSAPSCFTDASHC
jgi:hypothetical protein